MGAIDERARRKASQADAKARDAVERVLALETRMRAAEQSLDALAHKCQWLMEQRSKTPES